MSPAIAKEQGPMLGSMARFWLGLAIVVVLCSMLVGVAEATPAWRIDAVANSTVAPQDSLEYYAQITNIGDTSTDRSQIAVTVTLPSGIVAQTAALFDPNTFIEYPCFDASDGVSPVTGRSSLICTTTVAVPFAASGGRPFMRLNLTADVQAGAAGPLTAAFHVSGGGAGSAGTVAAVVVTRDPPSFGVAAFDGNVDADGSGAPLTQAGGHPYAATVSIDFNTLTNPDPAAGALWPVEATKDVLVDLPPGLVGNVTVAERCTVAELANGSGIQMLPACPATSQIGTTLVRLRGIRNSQVVIGPLPVFSLVTPSDVPAEFGFNVFGSIVVLKASLRSGGDYGLTVTARNIPEALGIAGTSVTFWGVPSASAHDSERACPGNAAPIDGGPSCRSGATEKAFLRLPTSCTDPGVGLPVTAHIDSWLNPGVFRDATWISHDLPGYPYPPSAWGPQLGVTDCGNVPFAPTFRAQPNTGALPGKPAGFTFDLSMPQSDDPLTLGESDLRKAVVTLPLGVRVSPSSADGLGACSPADIKLHTDAAPSCPDSSKIGSVTVNTPLLPDPLTGAVYLAKPNDNPFGTLLSIYIAAEGPGVVVKLPGRVDADPISGQLTATFDDNPQLPFSNLHVAFKDGPRAPLLVPRQCGTYTTHAVMTGWNGSTVASDSDFAVSEDGNGAPCPPSKFSPGFAAGTVNPVAATSSTFNLSLTRGDEDEEFKALTVDMPEGLLGKIANVSLCDAVAARAGTCSEASRVGDVTVGAGGGSNPFYITNGRAYITGPYKGAPFGLSIVVPAIAGPFDLGNVVVQSALYVDKHNSTLRVVSDPLPTILQGITLDVRDVRVSVNKPDFIVNPTSCEPKTITGSIDSVDGSTAHVTAPFRVGRCAALGFRPHMVLIVGGRGHTTRNRPTPLSTTITMPRGQANLRFVRVTLPDTINARLTVINDACTRAQFEADITQCAHARAGTAVASTPLLKDPLRGSVYFVKNGNPLPDLFLALRGQVSFDLVGQVTIPHSRFLRTTFATAPDVPIRSFSLRLFGDSRNGSVGAAANLCSANSRHERPQLDFIAQNGKVSQLEPALVVRGCKKPHHAKHKVKRDKK